jgi:hypothetical protein
MHWLRAALVCLTIAACGGCASGPYHLGSATNYRTSPELAEITQPQFERGKPRPVIDAVGWVFGIPSRIILWDWRIEDHDITPETEMRLAEYLAANDLSTVKVRLNEYDPFGEWDRLVANKSVGWGWRYTAGTLTWLGYTLLPGRLFGGDDYNPFTNTINLYSDVPAVALHEGGHAKDFAQRKWKGTYAVIYSLPGVPLWHEALATRDALGYLHEFGDIEDEEEGYRILYPAYGTYVGGEASNLLPWNPTLVYIGAVIPAHLLGRMKAHGVEDHRPPTEALDADREP